MKELIGKTIFGLRVSDDQSLLVFTHSDGSHTAYSTWGDCCSETWFADIVGVQALIDAEVLEVEEVEMEGVEDGRTRQEYDQFYGVKIKTKKGYADIVYRNSSNGYYGGSVGLHQGDVLMDEMQIIVDGWSA